MVGSIVNSIMFLLVIFSYLTSSALPFIIEVSVDLLNIGLKQHVVNTGEIFICRKLYIAYVLMMSKLGVSELEQHGSDAVLSIYSSYPTPSSLIVYLSQTTYIIMKIVFILLQLF